MKQLYDSFMVFIPNSCINDIVEEKIFGYSSVILKAFIEGGEEKVDVTKEIIE